MLLLILLAVTSLKADSINQNDPNWSVNPSGFQFSMTIVAYVRVDNVVSSDENDQIGVFVGNELRGTGNLSVLVGSTSTRVAFIQVYSNSASGENLSFKIYDASKDEVIDAVSTETFADGKKLGENLNPFEVTDNALASEITLSISSIDENETEGSVTATLGNNDPDGGQTFTYELVSGEGDHDNDDFSISGDQLTLDVAYDYESKTSTSFRLKVTDSKNGSFEQAFQLDINDQNDAPTAISLSTNTLDENQSSGFEIGAFTSTDQDNGDTHIYTLVSGTGDDDNDQFTIDNSGKLLSAASFDYETQSSFSVRVKSTDSGGAAVEEVFTITINDVNDAPTAIALATSAINENAGSILVTTLSATDQDAGDSHTFTLVTGSGSDNNSRFTIRNGNELYATESFDFEVKSSYSVRIKAQDAESGTFEQSFTITINDVNDKPSDISISNASVNENETAGVTVGSLSGTDQDAGETLTFSLVSGDGDEGNDYFEINNSNQLITKSVFNYENADEYSIRLMVSDADGASFEKVLSIDVLNVNDAPTAISLSSTGISENGGANVTVGTLSATDEDEQDTHTFTLVSGTGAEDNGVFEISSGQLKAKVDFNYEEKASYSIRLKVTDAGGLSYESVQVINIQNVNESPTGLAISNSSLGENQGADAFIATLTATDPDAGSTFTFELANGAGSSNNSSFSISNSNELRANSSFDFESKSSYSIGLKVSDGGGLSYEKQFTISVTDKNDSPTDVVLSASSVTENVSGAVIGAFTATDQDASDTHTFKLVEGDGDDSNSYFTINSNGQLVTKAGLNFEEASTHSVRVIVTDAAGASLQKVFTISVIDANDAPTQIGLSNSSVMENLSSGIEIGTILVSDEDIADTHSLTLVSGVGDTNNNSFTVIGSKLIAQNSFDYETQNSYSVRLKAVDSQGESVQSILIITVLNDNDEPSAISLSANKISENSSVDSVIGSFQVTDQDADASYSYSLVVGEGDTDNPSFGITNNQLISKEVFNHEVKSEYSVRIRATENGGNTIEAVFSIQVEDVNEEPTAISLSANSVPENSVGGTLIGKLSINDPDEGDTYDYVLKTGETDNLSFGINGGDQLVVAGELNFEAKNSYTITVTAIDQSGNRYEKSFDISITNVAEPGIAPSVTEIDFGLTDIGRGGSTKTFEVLNDGPDGILEITDFELPGGISVTPELATVNPGETMTFTLKFDPEEEGVFDDVVKIKSNAGEPVIEVRGQAQLVAGLEELPNVSDQMNVYPNPASDRIQVDAAVFGHRPFAFQFIDVSSGKTVLFGERINTDSLEINSSVFSAGLYIIELFNDEIVARKKVMIVR